MNTAEDMIGEAVLELYKACSLGDQTLAKIQEIIGQLEFGIVVAESLGKPDATEMFAHMKNKLEEAAEIAGLAHCEIHNLKISLSEWQNERLGKEDAP